MKCWRIRQCSCDRYSTVGQLFARRLLTIRDFIRDRQFQLTPEFLSHMLCVRLTSVREVAGRFQQAKIINYRQGKIAVVSKPKLKSASYEYYQLIAAEFSRLLYFQR